MRRIRLRNLAAAAALLVALSTVLSGCSGLSVSLQSSSSIIKASEPRVGECWKATFAHDAAYAVWNGEAPVSCATTHQLYTFAVQKLADPHKGKLFDKAGKVNPAALDDANRSCSGTESSEFSGLQPDSGRVHIQAYLPAEPLWDIGARWVRCDIAIFAVGSSVGHPLFQNLPSIAELTRETATAPKQFESCTNASDAETDPPLGSDAVIANCLDDPVWTFESDFPLTPADGGAYPAEADMIAQYRAQCQSKFSDATHLTYVYFPSSSDWASGVKSYACWVGIKP